MKKFFVTVALICVASLVFSQAVFAGDALRKLGRGISNVSFGWVDIPAEMFRTAEFEPEAGSFVVGIVKGFFKAIGRMAAGAYEIISFPIPVPAHYDPVVEPEFVF